MGKGYAAVFMGTHFGCYSLLFFFFFYNFDSFIYEHEYFFIFVYFMITA